MAKESDPDVKSGKICTVVGCSRTKSRNGSPHRLVLKKEPNANVAAKHGTDGAYHCQQTTDVSLLDIPNEYMNGLMITKALPKDSSFSFGSMMKIP